MEEMIKQELNSVLNSSSFLKHTPKEMREIKKSFISSINIVIKNRVDIEKERKFKKKKIVRAIYVISDSSDSEEM
jgi:hypothetical protein